MKRYPLKSNKINLKHSHDN